MFEYIVFFGMFLIGIIGFFIGMANQKKIPVIVPKIKDDYFKFDSPLEQRLYQHLVSIGYRPEPQVKVGRYRIDLAFPQQMLAVECDGKAYHSTPKQKEHDRKRDKYLREQGWTVLHFSGRQIYRNPRKVLLKIKDHLNQADVSHVPPELEPDILK